MEPSSETLRDRLNVTISRCQRIWASQALRHYTKHGVEHSNRIKDRLGEIVPLVTPPLSDGELFVLLNAVYLHDIGMQHIAATCGDKTVDQLDAADYEAIREAHNEVSARWIRQSARPQHREASSGQKQDSERQRDLVFDALGLFDDPYLDLIADVSEAHTKIDIGKLSEVVHRLDQPFRLRLLAALLIIGDELDLSESRVDFDRLKEMPLSTESKLHWWKHHYVDRCWVEYGRIRISMAVPAEYDGLIARSLADLVTKAVRKQLAKDAVKDVLVANGVVLQLDQPDISLDAQGRKKSLPPELAVVSIDEIRAGDIAQLLSYAADNAFPGPATHVYGMNVLQMTDEEMARFLDVYVHLLRTIQDLAVVKLDMTMRLLQEGIDAALANREAHLYAALFLRERAKLRVLSMIERSNHMTPSYLPVVIDDEYVWDRLQQGYEQGITEELADDDPDEWQIASFLDLRGHAQIWLSQNRAVVAKVDEITETACRDITLMVVGTDKLSRTRDPGMPLALGITAYKKPGFAEAFTNALDRDTASRQGVPADNVEGEKAGLPAPNTEAEP